MQSKKKILLKLTGEIFLDAEKKLTSGHARALMSQIKKLHPTHQFGIVIGGGNFFRARDQGMALGIKESVGHQAGMLATMINGLIIKDLLEQHSIASELLCALTCPEIGESISQQSIQGALSAGKTLVFTGGTGNPFFTNDTNAVIRGLQMNAQEIWKASNVDGVYNKDPKKNSDAQLLKKVNFSDAREQKLGIMDTTAFALAEQHNQCIRVFNAFADDALIHAADNKDYGTYIQ